jgi:hypothetical protein
MRCDLGAEAGAEFWRANTVLSQGSNDEAQ